MRGFLGKVLPWVALLIFLWWAGANPATAQALVGNVGDGIAALLSAIVGLLPDGGA